MNLKATIQLKMAEEYHGYNSLIMMLKFYIPNEKKWGKKQTKVELDYTLVCEKDFKDHPERRKGFYHAVLKILKRENDDELVTLAKEEINKHFDNLKKYNERNELYSEIYYLLKDSKPIKFEMKVE